MDVTKLNNFSMWVVSPEATGVPDLGRHGYNVSHAEYRDIDAHSGLKLTRLSVGNNSSVVVEAVLSPLPIDGDLCVATAAALQVNDCPESGLRCFIHYH